MFNTNIQNGVFFIDGRCLRRDVIATNIGMSSLIRAPLNLLFLLRLFSHHNSRK